jgi:hypothetical protein
MVAFFLACAVIIAGALPAAGDRSSRFEAAAEQTETRTQSRRALIEAESAGGARAGDLSSAEPVRRRGEVLQARAGAFLGLQIQDGPESGKGALVVAVVPGAPGEQAGIRVGDLIVSLAGAPVTGSNQFVRAASALQVGESYPLEVLRQGQKLTFTVRPVARPSRFDGPASGEGGAPQRPTPPQRSGPLDINVLRYALIDPATGEVTFVGRYDPQLATGPIPYADLLKEALEYPYPSFSLEPTPQFEQAFQDAARKVDEDIRKMHSSPAYADQWTRKVADLLLNDASLQADRKRLFDNVARVMGISGSELKRLYDAATGKLNIPDTEVMDLASKMLLGLGYTRAGKALGVLSAGGTPEELLFRMCDELGLREQYLDLLSRNLDPQTTRNEGIILAISEVCRSFGASEPRMQEIISGIRAGQRSANDLIDYMGSLISESISSRYGAAMLNGLVLGPEILSRIYGFPAPRVELVFKDVPSDSLLGEILFRADYALKSISSFPDLREQFPGHLTSQEFLWKREEASGYSVPASGGAMMGCTLIPAEVRLRVSQDGSVVEFGQSSVRVDGWLGRVYGQDDGRLSGFLKDAAAGYGRFLTENYSSYARACPELHTLSEAAKVIALARSIRQSGRTVTVRGATGRKASLPRETHGFWSAVFHVTGDGGSLTFIQEGGADFSRQSGDSWVSVQTDAAVVTDVMRQLAASAAFAETALKEAVAGNLEAARDLAERSARAMTGELDLTALPSLEIAPEPQIVASYGMASASLLEQTHRVLDELTQAEGDLARAQAVASSSPDEAERIRKEAEAKRDEAVQKFQKLLAAAGVLRSDPRQASSVAVTLSSLSAGVAPLRPPVSATGSVTPAPAAGSGGSRPAPSTPEEWRERVALWKQELNETEKQIEATRQALLRLTPAIQDNARLFEEWERSSDEAFSRSVEMAADLAMDFGISGLADRYETIYDLAKKLPDPPQELLEKYRHMVTLIQRLKESKALRDASLLIERDNQSLGETLETIRDGIGQIVGILNLDKTVPGAAWKYGSLFWDNVYNLTELYHTWKNITALERTNEQFAEAVRKLSERMRDLQTRSRDLRRQIEEAERASGSRQ